MISIKKIKLINSLKLKKYRQRYRLFTAEGKKNVLDLLNSGLKPYIILVNDCFLNHESIINKIFIGKEITKTSNEILKKVGNFKTPSDIIAVFEMPENRINFDEIFNNLCLFCDDIQNPGNLGTIIRTAEWFGINNIFCSENTVDVYNPKVVQATSGAIARVNINYVNTKKFFDKIDKNKIKIYGAFLEGENIFKINLSKNGIIIIGNEGQGISEKTKKFVSKKIFIPAFPENNNKPESLNVSIATAIICAEFRRRFI